MSLMEVLAIVLGLAILALILWALRRGEFDDETPKYEMLGVQPPEQPIRPSGDRLTIESRIVRVGLVGATFYYASRMGWDMAPAWLLALAGLFLLVTGVWGRDPISTRLRRGRHSNAPPV